ncbi:hypothetical protein ACHAXT_000386 [Thalassiosira profunda]
MKGFAALFFASSASAGLPRQATRMMHTVKGHVQRRPTLAHSVVGFLLFGASDAFAQQIEGASATQEEEKEEAAGIFGRKKEAAEAVKSSSSLSRIAFSSEHFSAARFLSAGAIGAFFGGYVYPFAYKRLDVIFKGSGFMTIAKKSLVEVFTVGIFANSVSMAARGVLGGKGHLDVLSHVKEEMAEITLNDLRVWFPYNLLAFGLIPISIRPATTSLMECLWQTYISLRSNDYQQTCATVLAM